MCWVTRFIFGGGPAGIPIHPIFPILFLVQDSNQPNGTGIDMQLKGFSEAGKANVGAEAHKTFLGAVLSPEI